MHTRTILVAALSLVSTAAAAQQPADSTPQLPPIPARLSFHVGALRQASPFIVRDSRGRKLGQLSASGTIVGVRLGTSLAKGIALEVAGAFASDAALSLGPRIYGPSAPDGGPRVAISEVSAAIRLASARACIARVCGNATVGIGRRWYDFPGMSVAHSDRFTGFHPDQSATTFLLGAGARLPIQGGTVSVDLVDTANRLRFLEGGRASWSQDVSLQLGIEKTLRRRDPRPE